MFNIHIRLRLKCKERFTEPTNPIFPFFTYFKNKFNAFYPNPLH